HPEIRRDSYIDPYETRRRDADYGESPTVQSDRGSDDVGVTPEFLPKFVTKDGHGMTVRRGIFLRQKRAAESWFHFEQIEIIAANDQTKNVLRFPGPCHSHGAEGVGGHPGERTILFGVIEKIQIGARLHTREPGI